jgi:hypothetical protein
MPPSLLPVIPSLLTMLLLTLPKPPPVNTARTAAAASDASSCHLTDSVSGDLLLIGL